MTLNVEPKKANNSNGIKRPEAFNSILRGLLFKAVRTHFKSSFVDFIGHLKITIDNEAISRVFSSFLVSL